MRPKEEERPPLNERILIVDDEQRVVDILSQLLEGEGYKCSVALSAPEALGVLSQGPRYDLLVTDLRMPQVDGIELVRQSLYVDPDMSVVVVTAALDVASAIEAMRLGADDYILKPFSLSEISDAVAKAIEKRSSALDNRQYQEELEARVRQATEDLRIVNEELRRTKEYLENLLNSTVDTILTVDNQDRIDYVNEGGLRTLGYDEKGLLGKAAAEVLADGAGEIEHIRRMLGEGKPVQNYETELKRRDGGYIPVNMSISLVKDADAHVRCLLTIAKDITEQHRLQQELKEMSIKDSLTGLYNQRYFYERLKAEIERTRRQEHSLSLLLFDIDQFKAYNDAYGHLAGDRVLQATGDVIRESTREHVDIGFRYGGDEFTVILPETDEKQAMTIAERVRKAFEERHFDQLTISIGLMAYQKGYSLRSFIQFADMMMYDAKRSGGNRVLVHRYDGPQNEDTRDRKLQ